MGDIHLHTTKKTPKDTAMATAMLTDTTPVTTLTATTPSKAPPKTPTATPAQERTEIIRRIRTIIRTDQLISGERIGTERALAERLGVTRAALRSALDTMERNHEIVRLIGRKGGIIVSDGKLIRNIDTIESLPAIARRQGFTLDTTVLNATLTVASPVTARHLGLVEGTPVYALSRLRKLSGTPLSLEQSALPARLFPNMLTIPNFGKSLYGTLRNQFSVEVSNAEENLDILEASEEHAMLLNVPTGSPLVRIRRDAYTSDGTPVEHAVDLFVASRIRFTLKATGYVRLSASA